MTHAYGPLVKSQLEIRVDFSHKHLDPAQMARPRRGNCNLRLYGGMAAGHRIYTGNPPQATPQGAASCIHKVWIRSGVSARERGLSSEGHANGDVSYRISNSVEEWQRKASRCCAAQASISDVARTAAQPAWALTTRGASSLSKSSACHAKNANEPGIYKQNSHFFLSDI